MRDNNLSEQTFRSSSVSLKDGFTYFLIGSGVGAAIALLFAPKSGNELRGEIADVTRRGFDATVEKAKDLRVQSSDVIQTVKDKADAVYDYAATKLAKGEDAVEDAVATSKNAINEGIDKLHNASESATNSRYAGRKSSSVM